MTFIPSLQDIVFEAWNRTEPCKDGIYTNSPFCPSCLMASIAEVSNDSAWALRMKERYERLNDR